MSHLDLPAAHWFRPFRSVHPGFQNAEKEMEKQNK